MIIERKCCEFMRQAIRLNLAEKKSHQFWGTRNKKKVFWQLLRIQKKRNPEMTTKYHRLWKYPDTMSGESRQKTKASHIKRFKDLWRRILSFKDYEKVLYKKIKTSIISVEMRFSSFQFLLLFFCVVSAEKIFFCSSFRFSFHKHNTLLQCGLIYGEMIAFFAVSFTIV